MRPLISSLVGTAVLIVAACAPTPGTSSAPSQTQIERQCFDASQVRNFRQGRTGTVYLRVRGDEIYQVDAAGGCTDLDFAIQLAVVPDGAGLAGGRVCTGDWARIVTPGSTSSAAVCRVRITKRLSDAEVAELPESQKP